MGSDFIQHHEPYLSNSRCESRCEFRPIRWSSTQWNSTRQAGDGDFSVPDSFSEKAPSASFSDRGESNKVWRLGEARKKRATNAPPPGGGDMGGAGRGSALLPGAGSPRLPAPERARGCGVFSAAGSGRDVSAQGGVQNAGAAAEGALRPRAAPEGR